MTSGESLDELLECLMNALVSTGEIYADERFYVHLDLKEKILMARKSIREAIAILNTDDAGEK